MNDDLTKMIEAARARPVMSADEREDQLRNFVAGNIGLENPRVTRALVDEALRRGGRL